MGYTKWENFLNAVSNAKPACEVSRRVITNHFPDARKMVELDSGSQDFALILSKGDHALFGKSTQAMKAQ